MTWDFNFVSGDRNVQVPAHLNFGQFMLNYIRQWGDKIAFECADDGSKITYKELVQYIVNLSSSLTKIGIGRGDIVALGSEKCNEFVATLLAISLTGATYTSYDLTIGRASLKHKLSVVQPKYFIHSNDFWSRYSEVLKSFNFIEIYFNLEHNNDGVLSIKRLATEYVDIDLFEPTPVQGQIDTAAILYSSGTTGMPKGVQLSHLNCILNSKPSNFSYESLHTVFMFGEWYHNYDTFMTYKFLIKGKKIVYIQNPTPVAFLKIVDLFKIDVGFVVPSYVSDILKMDDLKMYNLDSLKIIYTRGCPLHVKGMDAIKAKLPNLKCLMQGYGMTEAGELTSECWGDKGFKPGSVGKASPGIIFKVVDQETRQILGPNQHGEIFIKGPVLMKGYLGIDPTSYLDEDGFFKTGDLGYYDEDKYFYIVDRIKEIISYKGDKVPPIELESVILLQPAVKEVSVVGKPHPDFDELPTAFVVKRPGFHVSEQEIIDFVVGEVPTFMELTGGVRFINELPKNPRGKVLRRTLREILAQE